MHPTTFLSWVLLLDGILGVAAGILLLGGATMLARLLGLPQALMSNVGLSLLLFGGILLWMGTRTTLWRPAVWAVIACNVLWAVECVFLLVSGWVAPTALGQAFIAFNAAFGLVMAELEFIGLRKAAALA